MHQKATVGRVHVYVQCLCGEEVEFWDAATDASSESQPCENCGRTVEIQTSIEAYAIDPEEK